MLEFICSDIEKNYMQKSLTIKNELISINSYLETTDVLCDSSKKRLLCTGDINKLTDNNKLIEKLKNTSKVRFWYSSLNAEAQCKYHYLVNLIYKYNKNIELYELDLSNYNKEIYSIMECTEQELAKLIPYQKIVSLKQIESISNRWENLKKENSKIRGIIDNKLISIPEEDLTNKILLELSSEKEMQDVHLKAKLILKRYYYIDDESIFEYYISKLIEENKIIVKENKIVNNNFYIDGCNHEYKYNTKIISLNSTL